MPIFWYSCIDVLQVQVKFVPIIPNTYRKYLQYLFLFSKIPIFIPIIPILIPKISIFIPSKPILIPKKPIFIPIIPILIPKIPIFISNIPKYAYI